jgi:hypothetical protein
MKIIAAYFEIHTKPMLRYGKVQYSNHCALFVFFFWRTRPSGLLCSSKFNQYTFGFIVLCYRPPWPVTDIAFLFYFTANTHTTIPYCSKQEYIYPKMLFNYSDTLAHESEETLERTSLHTFDLSCLYHEPNASQQVTNWSQQTAMAASWRMLIIVHCTARCIKRA